MAFDYDNSSYQQSTTPIDVIFTPCRSRIVTLYIQHFCLLNLLRKQKLFYSLAHLKRVTLNQEEKVRRQFHPFKVTVVRLKNYQSQLIRSLGITICLTCVYSMPCVVATIACKQMTQKDFFSSSIKQSVTSKLLQEEHSLN